jgi:hypothetical protein
MPIPWYDDETFDVSNFSPRFKAAIQGFYDARHEVIQYYWLINDKGIFDFSISPVPDSPPGKVRAANSNLNEITAQLEQAKAKRNDSEIAQLRELQEKFAKEEFDALSTVYFTLAPGDFRQNTPAYASWKKEYRRIGKILGLTNLGIPDE